VSEHGSLDVGVCAS